MQRPSRQSASSSPLRASSTHTYHLRLCTAITMILKTHFEMETTHSSTESSTMNRSHNHTESKRRASMTHLKRHDQLTLQMGTSHSVGTLSTLAPTSHLAFVMIMILRRELWRPLICWKSLKSNPLKKARLLIFFTCTKCDPSLKRNTSFPPPLRWIIALARGRDIQSIILINKAA